MSISAHIPEDPEKASTVCSQTTKQLSFRNYVLVCFVRQSGVGCKLQFEIALHVSCASENETKLFSSSCSCNHNPVFIEYLGMSCTGLSC